LQDFTRQTTLLVNTNDTGEIHHSALAILDGIQLKKRIQLLGISLSGFKQDGGQMYLFDQTAQKKKETLAKAVDTVNDKFGEHTITLASTIARKEGPGVISPAWRPTGVRKSNV
jgi:DNA polymerase-4